MSAFIVDLENSAFASGEGMYTIFLVTQKLEKNGILSCLVGVCELIFYGAGRDLNVCNQPSKHARSSAVCHGDEARNRLSQDWEICVPTEMVADAAELWSDQYAEHWCSVELWLHYNMSLIWSYHRFDEKTDECCFVLILSGDVHLVCSSENNTRSLCGLLYPKLDVFIQSSWEMLDMVQLVDTADEVNAFKDLVYYVFMADINRGTSIVRQVRHGRRISGTSDGACPRTPVIWLPSPCARKETWPSITWRVCRVEGLAARRMPKRSERRRPSSLARNHAAPAPSPSVGMRNSWASPLILKEKK